MNQRINKSISIFIQLIIILLTASTGYSQNTKDSLETLLFKNYENEVDPINNLPILDQLYEYSKNNAQYLALEYAGQALQIAISIEDQAQRAKWHSRIADIYYEQKVYYLAMEAYFQAYTIFKELEMKKEIGYALINIGDTYYIQNVDDVSLGYYNQADSVFKEINNQAGIAMALNKIGRVNIRLYQYDTALEQFKKSLKIGQQLKNIELIAQSNSYFGQAYIQLEEYDKAANYFKAALLKYKLNRDQLSVGKTYFALGDVYYKMNNVEQAFINFNKAMIIFKEIDVQQYISSTYNKLASIHFSENDYNKAIESAKMALSIANDYFLLAQKTEAYFLLSEIAAKQKKASEAYDYHKAYSRVKDSLFEERKQEQFSELQVSLATKEKEKEIAVKEQEIRRQRVENYALFAIIGLFLVFAIYYFYNNRKIKRVNALLTVQNEEINQQKEEIENQKESLIVANKEIVFQKNEIENKNLKITSSINYASRIQRAMLSKINILKDNFNDSFVFFKPKEAVSGDFFWFSEVKISKPPSLFRKSSDSKDITKIVIAAVDCTGHGVPGAFMSMLGDSYLNQIVNLQKIVQPDKILYQLHKIIRSALQQDKTENNDGMDVALCVIDKNARTLEFSGAKNPLIYIQNNKINRINGDLMSIGGLQKEKDRLFKKHTLDISVPTKFFIYSDGFQDQFGGKYGRKFMAKPFRELLFKNSDKPFDEQHQLLKEVLKNWMGNYNQMDDITIIGVDI